MAGSFVAMGNYIQAGLMKLDRTNFIYNNADCPLAAEHQRTVNLIIKVRWILLLLILTYCALGTVFMYINNHHLRLSSLQTKSVIAICCVVILHNLFSAIANNNSKYKYVVDLSQIVLDLSIITLLVHITGGGSSWVWPLYMIVTFESAFLLNFRRCLIVVWIFSSSLYALALWAGYNDLYNNFDLNIFNSNHKHNAYY